MNDKTNSGHGFSEGGEWRAQPKPKKPLNERLDSLTDKINYSKAQRVIKDENGLPIGFEPILKPSEGGEVPKPNGFSLYKDHPTTATGNVAAPKPDEYSDDFGKLKWKVGTILAEQFLKYNDGKFTSAIELNPATHALTEFMTSENERLYAEIERLKKELEFYKPSGYVPYRDCSNAEDDHLPKGVS